MSQEFTPGAERALDRARARAAARGALSVEPIDLLTALADETESRAAALLAQFGLEPARVLEALGLEESAESPSSLADSPVASALSEGGPMPIPHSPALRVTLHDAGIQARSLNRRLHVGTEHLLASLISENTSASELLLAAGLDLVGLRLYLSEAFRAQSAPIAALDEIPPLDLSDPAGEVDLGRILDASANRAREGLRVVEDYARFVLDDPGLTRRLKEVRHRLADALKGFDLHLLIGSRDTREDVGTHIMTHSEQVRENPRAVLTANFKRVAEAMRTLEEYGKLFDVWIAGRFEILRYDVYTLEKMMLTSVQAYRAIGETRLMVLVGGMPTLGDLTWIVGEALAGGADIIELREKNIPDRELLRRAREIRILTAEARALFILNDRPDLARLASAHGVHLGQDDLSVRDARRIVGPNLLIGVSTHNRQQLDSAVLSGSSYLGVGPVFPSPTKEFSDPELAGVAFVQIAAETTKLPWFAIGGITEANLDRVLDSGATRIAVSAAVVRAERPRQAAARIKARLEGRDLAVERTEEEMR
jgi:thiamine-phosphate pyrophosphorylase